MSVELDGANNIVKTDTISEVTSANGVTVDGLSIKDSKLVTADSVIEANMSANSVDSDSYVDGSIDTAHIAADAITGAKIADDAINSEHYTDGSIDTAHLADGQVTIGKLATAVLTGATDIGAAIVDADLFLVDDGAGGTLRKTTAARIKTYAGGAVTAINNATANELVTIGGTTTELDAEANLTFDGNDLTLGNGNIVFGTASKGIYLGVTSATAANHLDDYEEGTATVGLHDGGNLAINTSMRTINYIKIGNLVTLHGRLEVGTTGNIADSSAITGAPFTPGTGDQRTAPGTLKTSGVAYPSSMTTAFVRNHASSTNLYLWSSGSDTAEASILGNAISDGDFLEFSLTYALS